MRAHLSCKKCTPVRPEHTRYEWQQDLYECTTCHKKKLPRTFDTTVLQQLEKGNKLYKACCYDCEKADSGKQLAVQCERPRAGAHSQWSRDKAFLVDCCACKKSLPVTSFSAARQRVRSDKLWACLECEYPACTGCQRKPATPHVGTYTCTSCMHPLCPKCGRARPRAGKYSAHKLKEWTCASCRKAAP